MPVFTRKTPHRPKKVLWTLECWIRWVDGVPCFGSRIQGIRYVIIARDKFDQMHFWQANVLDGKDLAKQQAKYIYEDLKHYRIGKTIVEVWKNGKCIYRIQPKEKQ